MRAMRRMIALTVAAALCLSLAVTPAVAKNAPGNASSSTLCDSHGAPVREDRSPVTGRDQKVLEPDLGQVHVDMPASAKGKAKVATFSATVPVYFHVITDGGVGNLTARQLDAQVAVLNKTFGGREGGFRTNFSFYLAGVTRTDNASWFAAKNESAMKKALRQGGNDALNVYTSTAGVYLGWAYLPDILTKPSTAHLDGIVLDWESLPGVSDTYAGQYDLGETLTHEAGHWLNLEHTFFGGCNAKGDFVDDTPAQKVPTFGCPVGQDTCKAPGLDPIHNYMDYSFDSCYTEFTAGQTQRMQDAWLLYRAPR
jgi:hypothetical protein